MSYSIGDGMVTVGLAGGIVGYFYVIHRTRQKRMEIIHEERMAAMERGIPLPEFPMDPVGPAREADPTTVPIMGVVFSTLSIGTMIALAFGLPAQTHDFWIAPLPIAFLGLGLTAYHLLKGQPRR